MIVPVKPIHEYIAPQKEDATPYPTLKKNIGSNKDEYLLSIVPILSDTAVVSIISPASGTLLMGIFSVRVELSCRKFFPTKHIK